VAGGIFAPPARFIGRGVAVPSASWKIVVALRDGESARDVTADTPAIAVVMPNAPGVGAHRWTEFVTSIDAIEAATGYDFLPRVAEETQRALEARVATR
jgi:endonuclease G